MELGVVGVGCGDGPGRRVVQRVSWWIFSWWVRVGPAGGSCYTSRRSASVKHSYSTLNKTTEFIHGQKTASQDTIFISQHRRRVYHVLGFIYVRIDRHPKDKAVCGARPRC